MKRGLVITTFNRQEQFLELIESFDLSKFEKVVIVNDGGGDEYSLPDDFELEFIKIEENRGIAHVKNRGLEKIMENKDIESIFVVEDDIKVLDNGVWEAYESFSRKFNIPHLNWCHPLNNKLRFKYEVFDEEFPWVSFYKDFKGAFSYFRRDLLESTGLLDESYKNSFEHIDKEWQLVKMGLIPPFWYAVDFDHEYLECVSEHTSTITNKPGYRQNWEDSARHFIEKWGHFTNKIKDVGPQHAALSFDRISSLQVSK